MFQWPERDLRDWIDDLEERNDLQRIKAEVDWNEEFGAITREVSSQFGPALLFENINGHKNTLCRRLFTNGTGSKKRMCRILGVPETTSDRELVRVFKERFSKPVQAGDGEQRAGQRKHRQRRRCRSLSTAGAQVESPRRRPLHHDLGSVVTRDPDNGTLNVGTYRGMIATKNTIGVLLAMTQGWGKHFSK